MNSHSGLSILIPIYNFDVSTLVEELSNQAKNLDIAFEILCYDDASESDELKSRNKKLKEIENVKYREFSENKGRSQIRNVLAKDSKYDLLLFIDSDSSVLDKDYLENYLVASKACEVVSGGTVYGQKPSDEYSLRYKYGKRSEQFSAEERGQDPYKNICLNNLLIKKEVFLDHLLDENILKYGHEDTKFALSLEESKVSVCHIDNAVEHIGLEKNAVFLAKTEDGVANFFYLIEEGYVQQTKLYKAYKFLKKTRFSKVFLKIYAATESLLMKNLLSGNPSLLLFDLYKLQLLINFSRK